MGESALQGALSIITVNKDIRARFQPGFFFCLSANTARAKMMILIRDKSWTNTVFFLLTIFDMIRNIFPFLTDRKTKM